MMETLVVGLRKDLSLILKFIDHNARLFGILGVIAVPGGYLSDAAFGDGNYDTLIPRMCSTVTFAATVLLYQTLDRNPRIFTTVALIGYVVTTCVWFSFLMYNAALSPREEPTTMLYWVVQHIVYLYLASNVFCGVYVGTLLTLLASFVCYMGLYFVDDPNWDMVHLYFTYPLPVWIAIVVVGCLAAHNRGLVRAESERAARSIGSNIAHELRTPLTGISVRAESVRAKIPDLVSPMHEFELDDIPVEDLDRSLGEIVSEAERAQSKINIVLVNTVTNPIAAGDDREFSALEMVVQTVESFPFAPGESEIVSVVNHCDFKIPGERDLIAHVVTNVLKNSLDAVSQAEEPSVTVYVNDGQIVVQDNGSGVAESIAGKIFDQGFTTHPWDESRGNGLYFSRRVMELVQGDISFTSSTGSTSFRLHFS